MNKKRVCLYIGSMELGGIGKLMLHLMDEFLKKGITVDLFLMKSGGEYFSQIPKEVNVFIESGSYIRRIYKFIFYLRRRKPNVSISARQRQDIGNILGTILSCSGTLPIISLHTNVSVENRVNPDKKKDNLLLNLISKILYRVPKKFIAVSEGVADDFSRRIGVERKRISVIYNPVYKPYDRDADNGNIHPTYKAHAKRKKYIIAIGRLTKAKDFETLIRAFKIVCQQRDVSLFILGEGPLRDSLEALIYELGLVENVFLLGYVENPLYYLSSAEALVVSSRWEGFGNVIVESLGVGVPVVSTDCQSGPSEILQGGKYGRLVKVGDYEAMSYAIVETIDNDSDPNFLIERAEDFATDKIAHEYLDYIFNNKGCQDESFSY